MKPPCRSNITPAADSERISSSVVSSGGMTRADEIQSVTESLIFWQAYEPSVKADLCSCALKAGEGWVTSQRLTVEK